MISYNENESKYVEINGKRFPRHLLKEVKKNLFQGGEQTTQYVLDEDRILQYLLEFGAGGPN